MIKILRSYNLTITGLVTFYCKRISASFVFLLCAVFTLQAQTKWFVIPGAPTTGTGNAWADPLDLQTAINAASAGDSVFAALGTYQLASGQFFTMKEGVKIYGSFAGTETSLAQRDLSADHVSELRGNNARVIYNNNNGLTAAALLDGFHIRNGNAPYGAGMMNATASPTVSNCLFAFNNGGGMYNASSSATIVKCIFKNNTGSITTYGGGITNASSNNVSIINCIFWVNTGNLGGGVYIDDLGPTSASIINCTFYGNTATTPSGAGAIYCQSRSAPKIQNCIIWGNGSGIRIPLSVNVPIITNNIIQGGYLGNWNVDPLFVNPNIPEGADNTFGTADDGLILQPGSLASNAGKADSTGLNLPATDMAGAARIQDSKVDMGVYETSFSCNAYTTLYVDSSIIASGNGGDWTTAFKTLDEALIAAGQCTNVDNIRVAKGTYLPNYSIAFGMLNNVKIYGGFPGAGGTFAQRDPALHPTILKGNGNVVFYNESINTTGLLDGFTITGGASQSGGGMYNFKASPAINNCVFTGNAASSGGGAGGGMYNREGAPVISNCIFFNNSASTGDTGGGGAIWNSNASPVISSCIFTNNTAKYGGAINNYLTSAPIIKNTVFAGNMAGGDGGAIGNYGTALKLSNVSFVNNNAVGGGGAIDSWGAALTVDNSIFWGNTAGDINKDIWLSGGGTTLNLNYSFTQIAMAGTGNILGSSSPFVDIAIPAGADGIWNTADDGLTLASGSPCINAGTPDTTGLALGNTDIAGNLRIVESAIDLGAYEYNNLILPITLISFTGSLYNGIANLQWHTDLESNFNHFEVEKSTDGSLFRPQGKISAKGTISHYTYSIVQQEPRAYYRLKMVDNDGSGEYSRIIILKQSTGNGMLVYPNPAISHINIKVTETGNISIYTAEGRLLKTLVLQAGVNTVDVTELTPGVYYVQMNEMQVKIIKK